jgi:hypothetical protein
MITLKMIGYYFLKNVERKKDMDNDDYEID